MRNFHILIFILNFFCSNLAFADFQERLFSKVLSTTNDPVARLDLIDEAIVRGTSTFSPEARNSMVNSRDVACGQRPERCQSIKKWSKALCKNNNEDLIPFFEALLQSIYKTFRSDDDARAFLTTLEGCSSKPTLSQLRATMSLFKAVNDKASKNKGIRIPVMNRIAALMVAIPLEPTAHVELFVEAIGDLEDLHPAPSDLMVKLIDASANLVKPPKGQALKEATFGKWINAMVRVYNFAGLGDKMQKQLHSFPTLWTDLPKGFDYGRGVAQLCKVAPDTGAMPQCLEALNKVYSGNKQNEMSAQVQRNLILSREGNFEEAKKGLSSLYQKAKAEDPGFAPWIASMVATMDVYLNQMEEARKALQDHLSLLAKTGHVDPLVKPGADELTIKMLRFEKKYAEAWKLVESNRKLLDEYAYAPFAQRQWFEYNALLVAVGLKDNAKIQDSLKRTKLDLTGDASEKFRNLAIKIVEESLSKVSIAEDLKKLEAMKGPRDANFLDFKNVSENL